MKTDWELFIAHFSMAQTSQDIEIQFPAEPSIVKPHELMVPYLTLDESIHQSVSLLIQYSSKYIDVFHPKEMWYCSLLSYHHELHRGDKQQTTTANGCAWKMLPDY